MVKLRSEHITSNDVKPKPKEIVQSVDPFEDSDDEKRRPIPFGKEVLKAARKRYLDDRWSTVNTKESLGVALMHGVRKKQ